MRYGLSSGSNLCKGKSIFGLQKNLIRVMVNVGSWHGAFGTVTGQPRGQSLRLGGVKNFFFSMFRLALVPTQPPIQCIPGALSPGVKGL
jgi:hypothetical protein